MQTVIVLETAFRQVSNFVALWALSQRVPKSVIPDFSFPHSRTYLAWIGIHLSRSWSHWTVFVCAGCLSGWFQDMIVAVYADCVSVAYTYTCKLNTVFGWPAHAVAVMYTFCFLWLRFVCICSLSCIYSLPVVAYVIVMQTHWYMCIHHVCYLLLWLNPTKAHTSQPQFTLVCSET